MHLSMKATPEAKQGTTIRAPFKHCYARLGWCTSSHNQTIILATS
jgi:hypothetical protein